MTNDEPASIIRLAKGKLNKKRPLATEKIMEFAALTEPDLFGFFALENRVRAEKGIV